MSEGGVGAGTPIDWGVAARPASGEAVSGDLYLVNPFDHGVLMAVVDGVGHGDEATAAARVAVEILERHTGEPVDALFKRCHGALTRTRGAVMTVGSFNTRDNTLTLLGVGNVEGRILRADANHPSEYVLLRSGLVGLHLPELHASVTPMTPGDWLILATDGVRSDFADDASLNAAPADLAARILDRYFKGTDDGLVLAARYLGGQHE